MRMKVAQNCEHVACLAIGSAANYFLLILLCSYDHPSCSNLYVIFVVKHLVIQHVGQVIVSVLMCLFTAKFVPKIFFVVLLLLLLNFFTHSWRVFKSSLYNVTQRDNLWSWFSSLFGATLDVWGKIQLYICHCQSFIFYQTNILPFCDNLTP